MGGLRKKTGEGGEKGSGGKREIVETGKEKKEKRKVETTLGSETARGRGGESRTGGRTKTKA